MMPAAELAERAGAAGIEMQPNGTGHRGDCPACGGMGRFIVSEDLNGKTFFKCYGRCEGGDILRALGVTWQEFYGDEKDSTTKGFTVVERNFLSVSEAKRASDSASSVAWAWDGYVAHEASTLLAGRPRWASRRCCVG